MRGDCRTTRRIYSLGSGIDTTKEEITFNMPANDVTATPNYEDIEYTVTVNGGTTKKIRNVKENR